MKKVFVQIFVLFTLVSCKTDADRVISIIDATIDKVENAKSDNEATIIIAETIEELDKIDPTKFSIKERTRISEKMSELFQATVKKGLDTIDSQDISSED